MPMAIMYTSYAYYLYNMYYNYSIRIVNSIILTNMLYGFRVNLMAAIIIFNTNLTNGSIVWFCLDLKIDTRALLSVYNATVSLTLCLRPYHVENTGSRPITEVKQRRARLVLGWVTAWEYRVL